jgi:hypothetical protein
VGRTKVAAKKAAIGGPQVDVAIAVPFKRWKVGFDDHRPARQRFDTAVFRASASLRCTGPFEANAGVSDYADITAEDLFVTGFAYGE